MSPNKFSTQAKVVCKQSQEGHRPNKTKEDDVYFFVGAAEQVGHPIEKIDATVKNGLDRAWIHVRNDFNCDRLFVALTHLNAQSIQKISRQMRQVDVLKWVSQESERWYSEALGIYRVFSDHQLLPVSLEAQLDPEADLEAWALFCFCYWTRSEERTSNYYDACLKGVGIERWHEQVWIEEEMVDEIRMESDFVSWFAETLRDWEKATAVTEMSFWLHHKKIIIWTNDNHQYRFVGQGHFGFMPLEGLTREISNLLIQSKGAAVLWQIGSAFSGQMTYDLQYEYEERGELRRLTRGREFIH